MRSALVLSLFLTSMQASSVIADNSVLIDVLRPMLLAKDYATESIERLKVAKCRVPPAFWEDTEVRSVLAEYRSNIDHGAYHAFQRLLNQQELANLFEAADQGRKLDSRELSTLKSLVAFELDLPMDRLINDLLSHWRQSSYGREDSYDWKTCENG